MVAEQGNEELDGGGVGAEVGLGEGLARLAECLAAQV